MILIRIRNGLGNQLFQYAYGLILAEKGYNVKFDLSTLPAKIANRVTSDISDIFDNPKIVVATPKDIRQVGERFLYYPDFFRICPLKLKNALNKMANRYRKQNGTQFFHEPREFWGIPRSWIDYIRELELDNNKNYYLNGFWEDESYFLSYRDFLIKEFNFKAKFDDGDSIFSKIMNSNSVSIHIRRGDYLSDPVVDYSMCPDEYYYNAIQYVESMVENPCYFVFSDDVEYCKKLFEKKENFIFVTGNKDYVDMQLMTLCKHSIVANSTFSFWGAFLNQNQGIVVAPKLHYIYRKAEQPVEKKFFQVDGWKYL